MKTNECNRQIRQKVLQTLEVVGYKTISSMYRLSCQEDGQLLTNYDRDVLLSQAGQGEHYEKNQAGSLWYL